MEATINEKIKEINNPVIDEIENAINKIETQMLGIIKRTKR